MFYQRDIIQTLANELEPREALVITGMRQVGKTTLLEHLYHSVSSQNKLFLDLENPLNRKIFEEQNFDAIWKNVLSFGINHEKRAYFFLDEIQYIPQISQVMKYFIDHWQTKFVVTGSSSYYLKNLFPESLTGRKLVFELFPLTFHEFLIFKNITKSEFHTFREKSQNKNVISYEKLKPMYLEYMEYGGFPAVVLEPLLERKTKLLSAIFTSYFEKDVKTIADFKDVNRLRDFILLLTSRIGMKLDITRLSKEMSLSRETIYSYLSFLENTYVIHLLPRFSKNTDIKMSGQKKLFFSDTGLIHYLGKISYGQLLENSVFQNLRQKYALSYYSKEIQEIDFIIDGQIALEVKTTATLSDVKKVHRQSQKLKLKENYILSLNYVDLNKTILAIDL